MGIVVEGGMILGGNERASQLGKDGGKEFVVFIAFVVFLTNTDNRVPEIVLFVLVYDLTQFTIVFCDYPSIQVHSYVQSTYTIIMHY